MKEDIAVIGLGTFGFELAVQLSKLGHGVLAIDTDEKKINAIKDEVSVAVQADVTDEDVLRKLEIEKFDKVIFGMSNALESIILSIAHMKKMRVKYIIGKANTRIKKEILLKIGADEVILPEISTAQRLAERISTPSILEKFEIDAATSLIEIKVPGKFHQKTLKELDLRKKYGITVILRRHGASTQVISRPDIKLEMDDIVFVLGDEAVVKKVFVD
ncbi:MAG TPA: TrkA family potassium uptake protein [Bacteroidetes bacterium]|nr:TrkA family potassium uptake protein [Bacteroidota bacterium]